MALFVLYHRSRDGKISIKAGDRIRILRVRPPLENQDRLVIEQLQKEGRSNEVEDYVKGLGEPYYVSGYIDHVGVVNQLQIQLNASLKAEYCMIVDFGDGQKTDVYDTLCDFEIVSLAEDNPQVKIGDRVELGPCFQWNRKLDRHQGETGRVVEVSSVLKDNFSMRDIVIQWDRDGAERVLPEWEYDLVVLAGSGIKDVDQNV